ncbi:MAG: hypothetical protein ACRDZ3_22330 [Acidimicrobiia bacterium]
MDRPKETPAAVPADPSTTRLTAGRRRPRRPGGTILTVVDSPGDLGDDDRALGDLVHKLAAALRAVRGHVPDPVWWDTGAADALIEYQARQPG